MKIVLSAVLAMFLMACSSENKKTEEVPAEAVKTETVKVEVKAPEVVEKVTEKEPVVEAPVQKVVESVKAEEAKVVDVTPVKPAPVAQAPKEVTVSGIDGAKLFTKCVACHGANGEKSALNKSKIIQGWSVDQVLSALHGYKAGTYGSSMKGVMKSQISSFSEEELQALAQHISKL